MRFATSYFGNRIVRHARADMQRLREDGFGIVVHTFSENDLRFYRGTLREIVAATREAGLDVWLDPWGVGGVFGGEAFSAAAVEEPSWLQVSEDGSTLPACCPNHPGFRQYLLDWIDAACETECSAIFWDEPHFHTAAEGRSNGCFCSHCRAIREDEGYSDDTSIIGESLTDLLSTLCRRVRQLQRDNVVCLLPHDGSEGGRVDWRGIAALDGVTNLGTVPFWALHGQDATSYVRRLGDRLLEVTGEHDSQSHLWVQGFQIPEGREGEITTAAMTAAELDPDVVAIWGFEACAAMSALACDRPEVAWEAFLTAVRRVSK